MKQLLIFVLTIIVILAIGLTLNKKRNEKLRKDCCFTITKNPYTSADADGRIAIHFSIIVENKEYKNIMYFPNGKEEPLKDTMRVKYVCRNPKISEIIFE